MTDSRTDTDISFLWTARLRPARWLLAVAALVAAVAHVPVIAPHLDEAPYMGEEFIVLTVACVLIAAAAAICDSAMVYLLGTLTGGLAVAGYLATRLTAFPQLADDVGNWLEPLGIVSVLAELTMVAAGLLGLRRIRETPPVGTPPVGTPPNGVAVQEAWADWYGPVGANRS